MENYKYSIAVSEPLPGETAIFRNPKAVKELLTSPEPEKIKSLKDILLQSKEKYGSQNCFGTKKANGTYDWNDYKTSINLAQDLGSGLKALNLAPPMKDFKDMELHLLGVYSKNREEYMIVDFAAILYGFTSVPIYDTLGVQAMEFIFDQTKLATLICAEENLRKFIAGKKYGEIKNVISFETIVDSAFLEEIDSKGLKYYNFQEIIKAGQEKPQIPYLVTGDTTYVISYTSGTTGNPKGAMLSQANFVSLVALGKNALDVRQTDVYISYLPLAHVFERLMVSVLLYSGCAIGFFSGDITKIKDDFIALKPTIMATAPRLLNRFHEVFKNTIDQMTGLKGLLVRHALHTKLQNLHYYGNIHHWIHDKIVFSKMRAALGGRLRWIVIGSAPTSKETLDFMKVALSCPIIEGYGQTEGTGASFALHIDDHKGSGSIGGPGVNTEFKLQDVVEMNYTSLDKDEKGIKMPRGEMCVRGPGVFMGYYKDEDKTNEAIDKDKWLHTGDVCQMLPNGAIKIIDRKKNIFKLSQGEYIAPEKLESIYSKCKTVSEIFLYGDSFESFLVAVIVPNLNSLKELAGISADQENVEEWLNDKKTKMVVIQDLKAAGDAKKFNHLELVKNVYLVKDAFATHDLVTTTFKLKRFEAKQVFAEQIKELYQQGPLIH